MMGYSRKWKPSKSQRREFAVRMKDEAEKQAYEKRKSDKEDKRRSKSQYDYRSAGGQYVPTEFQYNQALKFLNEELSCKEQNACNLLISGFILNEKVHHDNIHIVNELIRSGKYD